MGNKTQAELLYKAEL
jgi:hypothetical protein